MKPYSDPGTFNRAREVMKEDLGDTGSRIKQADETPQNDSTPRSLLPFVAIPHDGSDNGVKRELCPFMIQEEGGWLTVAYVLGDVPELNAEKIAWLFAAAPELLDACKLVQEWRLSDDCKLRLSREGSLAFSKLAAAVEKAEGAPSVPGGNEKV